MYLIKWYLMGLGMIVSSWFVFSFTYMVIRDWYRKKNKYNQVRSYLILSKSYYSGIDKHRR